MPTPSFVMIALVAAGTRNSSAANLSTAVNGAFSGTLTLFAVKVFVAPVGRCRVKIVRIDSFVN